MFAPLYEDRLFKGRRQLDTQRPATSRGSGTDSEQLGVYPCVPGREFQSSDFSRGHVPAASQWPSFSDSFFDSWHSIQFRHARIHREWGGLTLRGGGGGRGRAARPPGPPFLVCISGESGPARGPPSDVRLTVPRVSPSASESFPDSWQGAVARLLAPPESPADR